MSEQTTEQMCDCGHRRSKHHHGRGLCESMRGSGFTCSCRRFKHLVGVTPPKPLEPPQEICEQKPLCPCVCHEDGEPYCGDCMDNHWAREPKPAPQAEGRWHVCAWDVTLPGSEGMVEVLDEKPQLVCRAKDRATANLIAAQAPLLQKIADMEEKLMEVGK